MLSGFEILSNAVLIIQNSLVSRLFTKIFHNQNFYEKHKWKFSKIFAKFLTLLIESISDSNQNSNTAFSWNEFSKIFKDFFVDVGEIFWL